VANTNHLNKYLPLTPIEFHGLGSGAVRGAIEARFSRCRLTGFVPFEKWFA
jgi:hypothetical protein